MRAQDVSVLWAAPESSGRAAGVARSRATGSRAVAPGTEVVEGARVAGGTRFAAMRA